jgi:hypothetical protein
VERHRHRVDVGTDAFAVTYMKEIVRPEVSQPLADFRPHGETAMEKSNRASLKHRIYDAMKEFFFIAIYLWLVFGLFVVYRSVILAQQHIPPLETGFAVINALVLGKVMLVAKELHLGDTSHDAPLIYPTLAKSALFSLAMALFKILEEWGQGLYHGRSFHESIANLGGGTWQGIICLTGLLFVLLIPFFGFTELQRVLGKEKLRELFFRSRRKEEIPGGSA